MNNKLYVGNLPFRATSEDLQSLFAEVGTVESARVIDDRDTGRSRGFAFVEMSTGDEAAAAIEKFNGMDYDGRNLAVKEAQPREDNRGGGGGRRNNYGGGDGGRW
jgi:RNA recognition motif-containing protein